jgi:hypothetical protein
MAIASKELEMLPSRDYAYDMDAKTPKPIRAAPAWMVRSLEISEAEVDAGLTVPLEPVLERAREVIAQMRAARAARRKGQPVDPA